MKDSSNKKSNKRYTHDELLLKLEIKTRELGRVPTKKEIDEDKNMPSSSTYFDRFGGVTHAAKLIGKNPNVHLNLTLEYFQELAKEFYARNSRSPRVSDFSGRNNMPNSSFIRDELGMFWNEFLISCDLPIYDGDSTASKNRIVELSIIKKLKDLGVAVDDLGEKNFNSGLSMLINDKITVSIRLSGIRNENNNQYWKFHTNRAISSIIPDYYLFVGFNNEDFSDVGTLFWIAGADVKVKTININTNRVEKSKYGKYLIGDLEDIIKEGWIKNEI